MNWLGNNLKQLSNSRNMPISKLAERLGVSRQTVYDWIEGQVPKGTHLLALCHELASEPEVFFEVGTPCTIVPAHRTRRGARVNPARQRLAIELADEYKVLCEGVRQPVVQQVVRIADGETIAPLAESFRSMVGLSNSVDPMDYEHVFSLLDKLGVCVIFRTFPSELKDYAFYTRVAGHRMVFVNLANNVLDLIFPMLHEAVHAVRDEKDLPAENYDETEEAFCDKVASAAQFPEKYVTDAHAALRGQPVANKVKLLKSLATMHHHAVYGLVKAIEGAHGNMDIPMRSVHGADGNLRNAYPTLGQVLYNGVDNPVDYLDRVGDFSPKFKVILQANANAVSARKLSELLELPSMLDAQELRSLLKRE